jgi:thioredoxin 1
MIAAKTPIVLNDRNFREEVLDSDTPVLVDFCAEWISKCTNVAALMDSIQNLHQGELKVGSVDLNKSFRTAEEYSIRTFPTFLLFNRGRLIDSLAGLTTDEEVLTRLKIMVQQQCA